MVSEEEFFEVRLKKGVCIPGLTEDNLKALIDAIEVVPADPDFKGFVRSSNGTEVTVSFGPDGNFYGMFAKANSQNIALIHGTASKELTLFEGPPTASNPGPGWEVDATLTQTMFNQSADETSWTIFVAKKVPVLNATVVS